MLYYGALIYSLTGFLCGAYPEVFPQVFSWFRMLFGAAWCTLAVYLIPENNHRASTFFLYLLLWLSVTPLSAVYAVCGGGLMFYCFACGGFMLCIIVVRLHRTRATEAPALFKNRWIVFGCVAVSLFVLISIYINNGLPTLTALDIYAVYELRSSDTLQMSKYIGYLLPICISALLPFAFSYFARSNKRYIAYIMCLAIALTVFTFYLYTGHKMYLFSIFVVFVCSAFSASKRFTKRLIALLSISITLLCILVVSFNSGIIREAYMLICRRVVLEPQRIAFAYSDYFSSHPLFGLHGILPTALIPTASPYPPSFTIGREIAEIYFGIESNCSTGLLGDSVMHFGLPGVILSWLILGGIIRLLDSLERRTGFGLVAGAFALFIYSLSDAPLLSGLVIGVPIAVIIVACLFCRKDDTDFGVIRQAEAICYSGCYKAEK